MSLQYADIDDAVLLTQQELIKRGAFVDLQTDLTDHVAVREIWKGRQKKFEGGNDWEFECQIDHNHSLSHRFQLYRLVARNRPLPHARQSARIFEKPRFIHAKADRDLDDHAAATPSGATRNAISSLSATMKSSSFPQAD